VTPSPKPTKRKARTFWICPRCKKAVERPPEAERICGRASICNDYGVTMIKTVEVLPKKVRRGKR